MNEIEVVEKKIEEIQVYNDSLFNEINELVIVDNETLSKAANYLKKLKDTSKVIEEREKEFTKPLNDTLKKIRDVFRPQKEMIEKLKTTLERDKILPYQREIERKKREEAELKRQEELEKLRIKQEQELRRAEEEKNKIYSENALVEAVKIEQAVNALENKEIKVDTNIRTESTLMNIRKTWVYEIVDMSSVPREYCEPSKTLIDFAIKQGKREILGLKIYEKETIVSR